MKPMRLEKTMKTLRGYLSWLLLNAKLAFVFLAVPTLAQSFQSMKLDTLSLPPAAQAKISSRIGEDEQAYQFVAQKRGFRAENGNQQLSAGFTSEGVVFQQGSTQWHVSLQGY